MKVSVALASYNGEKFIKEQIDSILVNLRADDELIISDDGSLDGTIDIIKAFKDERITLLSGPKSGVKKNFENAISHCTGDIIFLCDQDDVWSDKKVETVLSEFEDESVSVVVHNCSLSNEDGGQLLDSYFDYRKSGPGYFKNIVKNSYMGCCMAFRAKFLNSILPIPNDIEMHDQWIGLICEKLGRSVYIPHKLIVYRRHESNASDCFNHYGTGRMIKNRLTLLSCLWGRKIAK